MRLGQFFMMAVLIYIVTQSSSPVMAIDSNPRVSAGSETGPLLLTATLHYNETSKDSNWSRYTVEIDQDRMYLAKEFGGFNTPDNERISKKMTENLAKKIWTFIKTNGLDIHIHEEQPTDGVGVAGHFHWEIKSPSQSTIHISGKTQMWASNTNDDNARATNISSISYINKANLFFNYLWTL